MTVACQAPAMASATREVLHCRLHDTGGGNAGGAVISDDTLANTVADRSPATVPGWTLTI